MRNIYLTKWIPFVSTLLALTVPSCSMVRQGKPHSISAGLTLHECPEALTGKLVFLVDSDHGPFEVDEGRRMATVYECNLKNYSTRKVTDAPSGSFVPSAQGDSFVVFWAAQNLADQTYDIRAWGYSTRSGQTKPTTLYSDRNSSLPSSTDVVGDTTFFRVWSWDGGHSPNGRVLRFNLRTGETTFLNLHGSMAHPAEDGSLMLHLNCGGVWQGIEVHSDQTSPVHCTKELFEFHCANDRYIFFEGPDAPIHGYNLISSPQDSVNTKHGFVDKQDVRVLKRFSRFSGGYYSLNALSPCRRYALVCDNTPFNDGWIRSYYVVNVSTGSIWLLLKDEVRRKTGGNVSWVYWLNNE